MAYGFTLTDVAFLRSPAGAAALAAAAALPLTPSSRLSDVAALRRVVGEWAAAVLETAVLRRRAVTKLDSGAEWLFTDDALQQATPSAVAAHRAGRLAGRDVHDVTCSVGADLAALVTVARRTLGSDVDVVRLAMAAHNVPGAALVRADAVAPVSRGAVLLADPARRDRAGRRRWHPSDLMPPLDELVAAAAGRDLVVKAAPGLD
ncbi:MAG: class I SAM-dependent methyltransferase, partial [Actinomycetota bacterium]|nr:class I SAM-dependent methyltransferase [Actinomycetota bacterium]